MSCPRIFSGLCQGHVLVTDLHVGGAAYEEVDPDGTVRHTVDVVADRGEETADLARAAGAAVPGLAVVVPERLQRVDIEEPVAGKGYSRQGAVVHRTLEDIDILAVSGELVHPPVPEDHAYRGAGLAVGGEVRKGIVIREALVAGALADSPGDVHVSQDNIIPKAVQGIPVALVVGVGGDIGHAAVEIHGAHGVAGDLAHLPDWHIILVIDRRPGTVNEFPVSAVAMASLIEEPLREIKVFLLPGGLVELHEGELDLLVAGNPMALVRTENRHHVVGHPDADIQKLTFPGDVVIRHSSLYHVAGAVHLMLVHVVPALVQAGQGVEGVDVTVFLLGGGEFGYPLVALRLKNRVGVVLEGICHPLESLVDIGVIEEYSRMFPLSLGGILKIADTAGLVLDLVDTDIQGHVFVTLEPWGPETVLNLDIGEFDRGNHFHSGLFLPGASTGQKDDSGQKRQRHSNNSPSHYRVLC